MYTRTCTCSRRLHQWATHSRTMGLWIARFVKSLRMGLGSSPPVLYLQYNVPLHWRKFHESAPWSHLQSLTIPVTAVTVSTIQPTRHISFTSRPHITVSWILKVCYLRSIYLSLPRPPSPPPLLQNNYLLYLNYLNTPNRNSYTPKPLPKLRVNLLPSSAPPPRLSLETTKRRLE